MAARTNDSYLDFDRVYSEGKKWRFGRRKSSDLIKPLNQPAELTTLRLEPRTLRSISDCTDLILLLGRNGGSKSSLIDLTFDPSIKHEDPSPNIQTCLRRKEREDREDAFVDTALIPKNRSPSFTRTVLPLNVRGRSKEALVDTGAHENAISETLARRLILKVFKPSGPPPKFLNAVGKPITASGYVDVKCGFEDSSTSEQTSRFWVFPSTTFSLVVGRKFLEATETLTRFRHRLKKIIVLSTVRWRVLHMELPRWRLSCSVGHQAVLANPDTGSDLDLMSLSFAQRSGFDLNPVPVESRYVEFADGSTQMLEGVVTVPFSVGGNNYGGSDRQFYVLDGLTSDVLLGNSILEELDAFNEHSNDLVDTGAYDEFSDFHFIRWVQRNNTNDFLEAEFHELEFTSTDAALTRPQTSNPVSRSTRFAFFRQLGRSSRKDCVLTRQESQARFERYLRFRDIKEERRAAQKPSTIARLSPPERHPARAMEEARRRQYDHDRAAFVARYAAAMDAVDANAPAASTSTLSPVTSAG